MLPADMFTAIRGGLVGERELLDRSYVGQLTNSKVRTMRASQILDKIDEDQELGKSNVRPVTGELPYSMLLVNLTVSCD